MWYTFICGWWLVPMPKAIDKLFSQKFRRGLCLLVCLWDCWLWDPLWIMDTHDCVILLQSYTLFDKRNILKAGDVSDMSFWRYGSRLDRIRGHYHFIEIRTWSFLLNPVELRFWIVLCLGYDDIAFQLLLRLDSRYEGRLYPVWPFLSFRRVGRAFDTALRGLWSPLVS